MRSDQQALTRAQRFAYDVLTTGIKDATGKYIIDPVPPVNQTIPAVIMQELPFTAAAATNLVFRFGSNAPQPTGILNNRVLGDNDIMAIYGVQVLYGVGANANNRVYNTLGVTPADDSIYNGFMQIQYENKQRTTLLDMNQFRDASPRDGLTGFAFINPIPVLTGRLGTFEVTIQFPNITGLVITANSFISVRLHGALGRA